MSDANNDAFSKAIIKACKSKVVGQPIDFPQVVAEVASTEAKYITDADVRYHLATTLLRLAEVKGVWHTQLHDTLVLALRDFDVRGLVIADIAHTRVSDLQRLGLWD